MKNIQKQGVLQGSVQSSILILFYIYDIDFGSGDLQVSLFADDVEI